MQRKPWAFSDEEGPAEETEQGRQAGRQRARAEKHVSGQVCVTYQGSSAEDTVARADPR